ncbi:MAG: hypothetical protein MZV70_47995 [Desulfobacterales bacterium]|nr:hypothetical protein [Desulfobacterales bacterium]
MITRVNVLSFTIQKIRGFARYTKQGRRFAAIIIRDHQNCVRNGSEAKGGKLIVRLLFDKRLMQAFSF